MDPVTILSIVSGSIGLAAKCASVAQQLYDIAAKVKQAELTIRAVGEECEIIRLAWTRIEKWVLGWADDAAADLELLHRLHRSIETGSMIVSALEDSLLSIGDASKSRGLGWRSRVVWNENILEGHQQRIRGLVASVHLLLDVVRLPSANNRHELLEKKNSILRRSDESAWTIVQSRPSTIVSSVRSRQSVESSECIYHEFSFDDQLFTARVYKRNYGNIGIKRNGNSQILEQQNHHEPLTSKHKQVQAIDQTQSVQVPAVPSVLTTEQDGIKYSDTDLSDVETIHTTRLIHAGSSHRTSTYLSSYEDSTYPPDSDSIHTTRVADHNGGGPELIMEPVEKSTDQSVILPVDTWHLDLAAAQGRYDVLETLLQKASSIQFCGWTEREFFNACEQGNEVMVQVLLNNGAIMYARNDSRAASRSAIHVAVVHSHIGVAELLLAAGADINDILDDGLTPMHKAARMNEAGMISFLLAKGALVDCCDKSGWQPIHDAAFDGHVEVVNVLLQAGGSAVVCDQWGLQPIHCAAFSGSVKVVNILLQAGGSAVACDYMGRQPIHNAAISGSVKVVNILLQAGGSAVACDHQGRQPIHNAAFNGSVEVVNILLQAGGSAVACDYEGTQPIYQAAIGGSVEMVNVLLQAGGSAVACDHQGGQPIHILADSGLEFFETVASKDCARKMVELLLSCGADIDAKNKDGKTPLYLAAKRKKWWLVEILQQNGAQKPSKDKIDRLRARDAVLKPKNPVEGQRSLWWLRTVGRPKLSE
ncbi:hypothetical protein MMC18_003260 [Xylographa bjoerkii]|nr:hypothetical protein [Xylographa bjoerkii]